MVWEVFAKSIKQQVNNVSDGNTLEDNVSNAINIVFALIGIAAIIIVIMGGISYATSQGEANKITKGKKLIITGLVGLIIVLLAFSIVNFVLNSLN